MIYLKKNLGNTDLQKIKLKDWMRYVTCCI
nr:MAG TPA: hypothetical protein [Caudoviricetes sp.]